MKIIFSPKKNLTLLLLFLFTATVVTAQNAARRWADSVYNTLTKDQRIAQLMVVRLSGMDGNRQPVIYMQQVSDYVKKYNVGGICLFQGSASDLSTAVNQLQSIAKTPIMVTIDGEWGLGMRMSDVAPLPRQMMLGAANDVELTKRYGAWVAEQCKRAGIQVNYAPVVDINNNPKNPVINDRSFGEDKEIVANLGTAYMLGMQENGVMACAKHFPGHGDVAVDSHYDLPVINKTLGQLDSLELYPFKKLADAGVGSMMIAHLFIPSIDKRPNRATSLSANNIKGILRNRLGYTGLTFTDALEMQGVAKFFSAGAASVESLIAGNDMLCLPGDVPVVIKQINASLRNGKLKWADIEAACKKVLEAKYNYGLKAVTPINLNNITADLNRETPAIRREVAEKAITLVAGTTRNFYPFFADDMAGKKIAYVVINSKKENELARRMKAGYNAEILYFDGNESAANMLQNLAAYDFVVSGAHGLGRSAASNFGLAQNEIELIRGLQQKANSFTFIFGNAYALQNFCDAKNMAVCYEDDDIIQAAAFDLLSGKIFFKGRLPVTVCNEFKLGTGIATAMPPLRYAPQDSILARDSGFAIVDSIVQDGLSKNAFPGAVVMAIKNGKIFYEKAFGVESKEIPRPVETDDVYDLASVTKICATTIAVMKLYDEGKLDLNNYLVDYLPELRGTRHAYLGIKNILLHQAGLVSYIPFYRETLLMDGSLNPSIYANTANDTFSVAVGKNIYMRKDWVDSMKNRIVNSNLKGAGVYVYSDNDFLYLGRLVEKISGMRLDEYVRNVFYDPMGLKSIGFLPMQRVPAEKIVPTEMENHFRRQLVHGYVHDPGAAMFGGVAGHAGLFSTAYDIGSIMQMLMNGGELNGKRYLNESTVKLFTGYQSFNSRRGFGFDKPERDIAGQKEPYPSALASTQTFGHTGFTGTCTWADPAKQIVYVFLSNRVNSTQPEILGRMSIRGKVQDALYKALE